MRTKNTIAAVAAAAVAAIVGAASAAPTPGHATLVIRHQLHGCHMWSLDGGAYRATQTVMLRRGGSLVVVDNDMMRQTLVQTAGPVARIAHRAMRSIGATATISLAKPGVYRFTTRPGEDYMPIKTTGDDNVLRLIVRVR